MDSPAEHLRDYIEAELLAPGWKFFFGGYPESDSPVVAVRDTGGSQDNPDGPYQTKHIQVSLRSQSYSDGYEMGERIRDLLVLPTSITLEGWRYTGFWLISDLSHIGRDSSERDLFSINFRLMRQEL